MPAAASSRNVDFEPYFALEAAFPTNVAVSLHSKGFVRATGRTGLACKGATLPSLDGERSPNPSVLQR